MNEYEQQAEQFLKDCNASIKIEFVKKGINENWNDKKERNIYKFTIITPRGSYSSLFYDSIANTERQADAEREVLRLNKWGGSYGDRKKAREELKAAKEQTPRAYDILACLTKYDPYTFEDFCSSFGYDTDSMSAYKTYNTCIAEYLGLLRIFTSEQMEKLTEVE